MTRVYDRDRPPAGLNAMQIAAMRAERLEDPIDRQRFLDAFQAGRVAAVRQDERAYLWYRAALNADHSATVAGLIEGAASVTVPGDGKALVI